MAAINKVAKKLSNKEKSQAETQDQNATAITTGAANPVNNISRGATGSTNLNLGTSGTRPDAVFSDSIMDAKPNDTASQAPFGAGNQFSTSDFTNTDWAQRINEGISAGASKAELQQWLNYRAAKAQMMGYDKYYMDDYQIQIQNLINSMPDQDTQGYININDNIAAPPKLQDGSLYLDLFNILQDRGTIQGILQDATNTRYDNLDEEFEQQEGTAYREMDRNLMNVRDAIRRSQAEATRTGASAGIGAANELTALLGLGQQNSELATNLAQDRQQLASERQAQLADDVNTALNTSNQLGIESGNFAMSQYTNDTQSQAAALAAMAQRAYADAIAAAGESERKGVVYNADQVLKGIMEQIKAGAYK